MKPLPTYQSVPLVVLLGLSLAFGCRSAGPDVSAGEFVPDTEIEAIASSGESEENASAAEVTNASAVEDPNVAAIKNVPEAVFAESGIAIRGADAVAYFTEGTYVPGNPEFTYEWGGAVWQFASTQNRDAFAQSPTEYAPQYGGFCAWAVSQGYTAPVDPTAWKVVDGKLYLNFNAGVQKRWQRDIPGNIAKGDRNWPGVLSN